VSAAQENTRYDSGLRRRTVRRGRERGCWLYVPAEVLREVGWSPDDPPPWSRVWPGRRRTVLVQLYGEP
jgi:hypothetical protein